MNNAQFEPRLKAIPDVPKEFGEDGGQFYRYYDALADELDEDMVKTIKSQLDSILIFVSINQKRPSSVIADGPFIPGRSVRRR